MINSPKTNSLDLKIANEIFKPVLIEIARNMSFAIKKNNYNIFVMSKNSFENNQDNYFQITMSRHGTAQIYPPVHISIWLCKNDFIFQTTIDLQLTTPESIKFIIYKLVADFCT